MKRVAFAVLWLMMVVGPLSWGVTQAPGALPAVTAWSATGPEGDALQKAAEQYTRQTGNPVNVVLQARPTYRDKLQIALTGGSHEPDMALIISRDLVPYAAGGFVAPLDGYMTKAPSY